MVTLRGLSLNLLGGITESNASKSVGPSYQGVWRDF